MHDLEFSVTKTFLTYFISLKLFKCEISIDLPSRFQHRPLHSTRAVSVDELRASADFFSSLSLWKLYLVIF